MCVCMVSIHLSPYSPTYLLSTSCLSLMYIYEMRYLWIVSVCTHVYLPIFYLSRLSTRYIYIHAYNVYNLFCSAHMLFSRSV